MPVINYLWSKECTLVDQGHHACEHCPSWNAVQQNDYHLNSICLMATIKFIVTICKKNCNIVTWIVNYLIASIPHNKLYVITIFNWLPPISFSAGSAGYKQQRLFLQAGWLAVTESVKTGNSKHRVSLTQTSGLASSFLHPSPDSWQEVSLPLHQLSDKTAVAKRSQNTTSV